MPPPGDSVYSRTPSDAIYSRTNSVDRHMLGRSLPAGSTPSPTSRPTAVPGTSSPTPTPTGGAVSPTGRLSMSGASTGLGALVSPSKPSAAGAIQATKYVGVGVSPTGRTRSVSASVQGSTSTLLNMGRGESVDSDWEGNQVNAFTLAMDSLSPTPRGMSPVERGGDTATSTRRRLSRASPSSPSVTTPTARTLPPTSSTISPDTTPTATAPSRTLPLPLPLPSPPADLPDITTAPLRGNDSIDRILAARRAAVLSPRPADPTASPILRAVPRPATPTVSAPATPRLVPLPGDPPRRTSSSTRTPKLDRAVQGLLVWTAAVWPMAVPVAGMYWRMYVALRKVGRGAQATAVVGMVLGFPAAVILVAGLMWATKWMPRFVRERMERVDKWARRAAGGVGVAPVVEKVERVNKVRGKKSGKRRDSASKTTAVDGMGKDREGMAPRAPAPS
ncbi:hypothetical protein AMAG_01045 [Allomyces macrogynus ATCC 38327]|uniref:Uncharacterized protein n=1 Tax=Allomyces macrogynus (strain ATCC 38327) TaxID=578462 RepID=A0A0L0RYF2_ALLM3|nr:hypothetical protein AMAG_01045 [Allomyces macrogynus ATCC 38327]|eukprot:KNE55114.1 hypothetical protein AMAG_01045 [Allomyces macrogynus ATCC 38327]